MTSGKSVHCIRAVLLRCCLGSETDWWAGRWMDARLEHVLRVRNVSTMDEWKIQIFFFKFISSIIAVRIMRVGDRWWCVVEVGQRESRGQIESIKIRITPGRWREWCEEKKKNYFWLNYINQSVRTKLCVLITMYPYNLRTGHNKRAQKTTTLVTRLKANMSMLRKIIFPIFNFVIMQLIKTWLSSHYLILLNWIVLPLAVCKPAAHQITQSRNAEWNGDLWTEKR